MPGRTPGRNSTSTGTRTINSYLTFSGGSLMYGFWTDYGAGWADSALGTSGYQVNASEKELTYIIPSMSLMLRWTRTAGVPATSGRTRGRVIRPT
jgi:hypothetical protein